MRANVDKEIAQEKVEEAEKLKAAIRQNEIEIERDNYQMFGFHVKTQPILTTMSPEFSFRLQS